MVQQTIVATRPRLGESLVEAGKLSWKQLQRGLASQQASGVRLGEALVHLGYVDEEDVAAALGRQRKIPYIDLRDTKIDPATAGLLSKELAILAGVLPLYRDGRTIVTACVDLPERCVTPEVRAAVGETIRPVLTSQSSLDTALTRLYQDEYHEQAVHALETLSPDNSASRVLSTGQKVFFALAPIAFVVALIWSPVATLTSVAGGGVFLYCMFSLYKLYLMWRSLSYTLEISASEEEVASLADRDLPIYTILVPLYREARVLPTLVEAIAALDYPKEKLDVRLLLEADDVETLEAVEQMDLPRHFHSVVVPVGKPRGKPKACNYGLLQARGEYVVIYDAEDIPEPDQLKKAILGFQKAGEDVACIQAKLNFFNHDQNILTRWFTAEYSMWFDIFLPGLSATKAPIPLGGTSNHFRTALLKELGAWDPYNVTEDADLGMRLFISGYKTAVMESTTYEEANSDVYNWIRQRSRWVKGYAQTYLVHMRHPLRLLREIGLPAFLSFQFVLGGTVLVLLINPVFWALTLIWFASRAWVVQEMFPGAIFYPGVAALILGNFVFTYANVVGCLRRGHYGLIRMAFASPFYWALMSVAAWKGCLQLIYAPSYWEKTDHGLHLDHGAMLSVRSNGQIEGEAS